MKKYLSFLTLFTIVFSLWINITSANIDLMISPIKYEINVDPGDFITKTAKLINKSENTFTIHTWKSDFIPTWKNWNPKFVRKSELTNPDQELANWITINTDTFIINPKEEKIINFSINVPADATPGWHYWAVFFKNYWSENSGSWWEITINVDYWVLLLITVSWEIIDDTEQWDISINTSGWNSWNEYLKSVIDECIIDLTNSNIDGKCLDFNLYKKAIEDIENQIKSWTWEIISINEEDLKELEDSFKINFNIPFINNWNTHIKPIWKIKLLDENWNEIKGIWKEIIQNDQWTIIGEKIVDYIPINDIWWNILPNSERVFNPEWNWFPYEAYDENWKKIIEYWTPWEYYTKKNAEQKTYIYPWERENERLEQKKIQAIIEVAYKNYEWEDVEFSSAQDFLVNYKTKYIWLNPYFIIGSILTLWLLLLLFIIFRKILRIKCPKCKKSIKKNMKICPYCWTKQKNKK